MTIDLKNNTKSKSLSLRKIRKELRRTLQLLGYRKAELSVLFVGPVRMRTLNRTYRGIDRATDVLSFSLSEGQAHPDPEGVLGDIVVCVAVAERQAREIGHSFEEEIRRLLIHGLLHLIGYDHEGGKEEKRRMEKKEGELWDAVSAVA